MNLTENYRYGDPSHIYETYHETRSELFRAMQKEYGHCTSKVYVNEGVPIGWVFESVVRYDDTDEPFLREVWITVHSAPPTKTIEYHYA